MFAADAFLGRAEKFVLIMLSFVMPVDNGDRYISDDIVPKKNGAEALSPSTHQPLGQHRDGVWELYPHLF